jgi:hypothetical protein
LVNINIILSAKKNDAAKEKLTCILAVPLGASASPIPSINSTLGCMRNVWSTCTYKYGNGDAGSSMHMSSAILTFRIAAAMVTC